MLKDWQESAFAVGRHYFPIGNGRISGFIQWDESGPGTPLTLLLQDPDVLDLDKRDKSYSFLFDGTHGLDHTALTVRLDEREFKPLHSNIRVGWEAGRRPIVQADWWAGSLRVTETFLVPRARPLLFRVVTIENRGEAGARIELETRLQKEGPVVVGGGVKTSEAVWMHVGNRCVGATAFQENAKEEYAPGDRLQVVLCYMLGQQGEEESLVSQAKQTDYRVEKVQLFDQWASYATLSSESEACNHLAASAARGLMMCASDNGRVNAGIWQYHAEWVRDSSLIALGALHSGQPELAGRILAHIIQDMVNSEGCTMIANEYPGIEHEQFDQAGQLLYATYHYLLWTGNDALIRSNWDKLMKVAKRLMSVPCRDPQTLMFHNKREFWERSEVHGIQEGYELAYQVWPVVGLRAAADLVELVEGKAVGAPAARWRQSADRQWESVLTHPSLSLQDGTRLIKRKTLSGDIQETAKPTYTMRPDIPLGNDRVSLLNPDSSVTLAILYELIDAKSDLARHTLDDMEQLWNLRWEHGGYDRYHTSSEPDTPGPWGFASLFIGRSNHRSGRLDHSWKVVQWLTEAQGGCSGSWHEYIPAAATNMKNNGILIWIWAEIAMFVTREILGVSPGKDYVTIKPALFGQMGKVNARIPVRGRMLELELNANQPQQHKARWEKEDWVSLDRCDGKLAYL